MGGVKKAIFGTPAKEKSESGNYAYEPISQAFTPALGYVTQGGNAVANMLGVGTGDQKGALENFANSGGMQFLREQGMKGITSSKAASGLLKSGSFGTAISKYNQGLASTYLNQYMDNLFKLGNLGLGAGGAMAGAGGWSKGNSSGAKQGIGSMLAQGVGAAIGASDERLKEDIVPIGERLGLQEYEFSYKQNTELNLPKGRFRGFMADDVPTAYLAPEIKGYKMVKAPYLPERIN